MASEGFPDVVQYSTKRVLTLTWQDKGGTPINLTNATLTGIIKRSPASGVTYSLITGTFALVTAASGIFTWTLSAADVAQAGDFMVSIYARYSSDTSKPEILPYHRWRVLPAPPFPFVSPSISPSASVSPSASASPSS